MGSKAKNTGQQRSYGDLRVALSLKRRYEAMGRRSQTNPIRIPMGVATPCIFELSEQNKGSKQSTCTVCPQRGEAELKADKMALITVHKLVLNDTKPPLCHYVLRKGEHFLI